MIRLLPPCLILLPAILQADPGALESLPFRAAVSVVGGEERLEHVRVAGTTTLPEGTLLALGVFWDRHTVRWHHAFVHDGRFEGRVGPVPAERPPGVYRVEVQFVKYKQDPRLATAQRELPDMLRLPLQVRLGTPEEEADDRENEHRYFRDIVDRFASFREAFEEGMDGAEEMPPEEGERRFGAWLARVNAIAAEDRERLASTPLPRYFEAHSRVEALARLHREWAKASLRTWMQETGRPLPETLAAEEIGMERERLATPEDALDAIGKVEAGIERVLSEESARLTVDDAAEMTSDLRSMLGEVRASAGRARGTGGDYASWSSWSRPFKVRLGRIEARLAALADRPSEVTRRFPEIVPLLSECRETLFRYWARHSYELCEHHGVPPSRRFNYGAVEGLLDTPSEDYAERFAERIALLGERIAAARIPEEIDLGIVEEDLARARDLLERLETRATAAGDQFGDWEAWSRDFLGETLGFEIDLGRYAGTGLAEEHPELLDLLPRIPSGLRALWARETLAIYEDHGTTTSARFVENPWPSDLPEGPRVLAGISRETIRERVTAPVTALERLVSGNIPGEEEESE